MARKIFAAVGGGYASLFYGAGQVDRNSRWMCIATGVAYSQNIVLGYEGTLPRHSPSFATMFLQIRNEPFHSYLLPVWTNTYTGLGLEIKRPLSLFRRSVLRIIINPLFGKFELCSACSDVRDTVGAMTTTISAIAATMHDETLDKGRGLRPAVPFRAPLISCFASGPIRKIDGGHSKKLLDKLERSVVRGRPLQEIC